MGRFYTQRDHGGQYRYTQPLREDFEADIETMYDPAPSPAKRRRR